MRRLGRIAGAYLAASVVAALIIALALVLMLLVAMAREKGPAGIAAVAQAAPLYWLLLGFVMLRLVIALALLPAAVVIAIAEAARLRSATFYAVAGSIGAVTCWALTVRQDGLLPTLPGLQLTMAPDRLLATAALTFGVGAAGLMGAMVYWRLAGRTAGDWRPPRPTPR